MSHRTKQDSELTRISYLVIVCLISFSLIGLSWFSQSYQEPLNNYPTPQTFESIPVYSGSPSTVLQNNTPSFSENDPSNPSEHYSDLDDLGRCGAAVAVVGIETMPTEKRSNIGKIKPSGWHTIRYDDLIESKYLYNRCHLIAYQLTGENRNEKNLITGTNYLNIEGMLPFEKQVARYIKQTNNHVRYRATPIFVDKELVARGVQLEAYSIEDNGSGISFNVFCFNVQPGITIDYSTGESWRSDSTSD